VPEGGRLGTYYSGADSCLVRGVAVVCAECAEPHDAAGVSGGMEVNNTNVAAGLGSRCGIFRLRFPKGLPGLPAPAKALCRNKERVAEGIRGGFGEASGICVAEVLKFMESADRCCRPVYGGRMALDMIMKSGVDEWRSKRYKPAAGSQRGRVADRDPEQSRPGGSAVAFGIGRNAYRAVRPDRAGHRRMCLIARKESGKCEAVNCN